MIYLFIMFFFFLYTICEILKYKKIESIKLKTSKRLYNKKIVFIKAFVLIAFIISLFINRVIAGDVENSAGIKSFFLLVIFLIIISAPTIIDVKKVLSGYNEKLLEEADVK